MLKEASQALKSIATAIENISIAAEQTMQEISVVANISVNTQIAVNVVSAELNKFKVE